MTKHRRLLSIASAGLSLLACWNCSPTGTTRRHEELRVIDSTAAQFFDSRRAFADLVRQVRFGPRIPGTDGHDSCRQWILAMLRSCADTVLEQNFTATHVVLGKPALSNIIARYGLGKQPRLLLSAHWDSRPWADNDPDPSRRGVPVPGANDGASGVAVLMELARAFRAVPPNVGVDIVLFDGEDVGTVGVPSSWCLGSAYFAEHLPVPSVYVAAVNIDMVGGKNLHIRREGNSQERAPEIVDELFRLARGLSLRSVTDEPGIAVLDDHCPLQQAGIPAVDLVDLDYRVDGRECWHTTFDTPDNCSAASLAEMGTLLLHYVYDKSAQKQE